MKKRSPKKQKLSYDIIRLILQIQNKIENTTSYKAKKSSTGNCNEMITHTCTNVANCFEPWTSKNVDSNLCTFQQDSAPSYKARVN